MICGPPSECGVVATIRNLGSNNFAQKKHSQAYLSVFDSVQNPIGDRNAQSLPQLGLMILANSTMTTQKGFLRLLQETSQWYVYAERSRSAEPSIRNATRRVRGASGKWDARGENLYRGYREQTPAPSLYSRSLQSLSRRLDRRSLKTLAEYVSWCAA